MKYGKVLVECLNPLLMVHRNGKKSTNWIGNAFVWQNDKDFTKQGHKHIKQLCKDFDAEIMVVEIKREEGTK